MKNVQYEVKDFSQSKQSKMSNGLMDNAGSTFGRRINSQAQNNYDIFSNPLLMRGSLNVGQRKNEMIRINQGNKKILQQLRQVKPTVGTVSEWKKHEERQNHFKKNIRGMHLDPKFRKEVVKC